MAERLVAKTAISAVPMLTSGSARLVFSIAVGRAFGAGTLGSTSYLVSLATFATLICSPGLGQAVAREYAHRHAVGRTGRRLLTSGTIFHHLVVGAVGLVAMLVPNAGWSARALTFALIVTYGAYTYYKSVLYGADLVTQYVWLEITVDVIFVLALLAVGVGGVSSLALLPMVLMYGLFSIAAELRLGSLRGWPVTWDWPTVVRLFPFAMATSVGTASSTGFLQLAMVYAGHSGTHLQAGYFAAALAMVTPAYLLPRAMSVVLFPAMARASGRGDQSALRRQLDVGTRVLAGYCMPAFVFAVGFAPALLEIAYGAGYQSGRTTFVILIWASWISIVPVPSVNLVTSRKPGRHYLIPMVASVVGLMVGCAWWVLGPRTIENVAWGYLVGSLVQTAVPMVAARRLIAAPSPTFYFRVAMALGIGVLISIALAGRPALVSAAVSAVCALLVAGLFVGDLRATLRPAGMDGRSASRRAGSRPGRHRRVG